MIVAPIYAVCVAFLHANVVREDAFPVGPQSGSRHATACKKLGAEYFVVSSDYPHSDGAFPEALQQFFGLKLDAGQRKKILWDNCARLYNIAAPAGSLTQPVPQASAAE